MKHVETHLLQVAFVMIESVEVLEWVQAKRGVHTDATTLFFLGVTTNVFLVTTGQLGHPAKNDCSTEVLHDFCTRATFLRSVPGGWTESMKPLLGFSELEELADDWPDYSFCAGVAMLYRN
jgi:hypothetical protein